MTIYYVENTTCRGFITAFGDNHRRVCCERNDEGRVKKTNVEELLLRVTRKDTFKKMGQKSGKMRHYIEASDYDEFFAFISTFKPEELYKAA